MFDVITFGSATQDVFLQSKDFKKIKEEKKFFTGKGICFTLGAKIPIEKIAFLTGGGGTNTAFTFKNQGFSVAYCGKVGDDFAGREIKKELEKKGISTDFLFFDKKTPTNFSVILSSRDERTILVYRGASSNLKKTEIPFSRLKAKWFYLAPLSGKLASLWETLVTFAKKNGIKVAVNPGNTQLSFKKEKLKKLLNLSDILILNQEEASLCTGLPYFKEKEIFQTLDRLVEGIVIMTKGPLGAVISDGKYIYEVGILKAKKIEDRTGCGDAFGSGFVAGIMKKERRKRKLSPEDIEYAIQLASANATSVIQKLGAKNGLLTKNDNIFKWGKVKIKRKPLK